MPRLPLPQARYTKTPNRLLDETVDLGASFPARHRSIVDLLVRHLYGWQTSARAVAIVAIARRLRVSPRTVRAAVDDLERWSVLRRSGAGRGRVAVFEILEPSGWRITKTRAAIERAERRRIARGGDQLLLPYPDLARILEIPTTIGVRTRDTTRGIPRSRLQALTKRSKRKKKRPTDDRGRGSVPLRTLSRPGDRKMPDRPIEEPPLSPQARRHRAAWIRLRHRYRRFTFSNAELADEAALLSEADVDATYADLEGRVAERGVRERSEAQTQAIRREHRR